MKKVEVSDKTVPLVCKTINPHYEINDYDEFKLNDDLEDLRKSLNLNVPKNIEDEILILLEQQKKKDMLINYFSIFGFEENKVKEIIKKINNLDKKFWKAEVGRLYLHKFFEINNTYEFVFFNSKDKSNSIEYKELMVVFNKFIERYSILDSFVTTIPKSAHKESESIISVDDNKFKGLMKESKILMIGASK